MTATQTADLTRNAREVLQTADTDLLVAVMRGQVNLNDMARLTLASRGLDLDGEWIGFDAANRLHGFTKADFR
jgi:hypothetical protein